MSIAETLLQDILDQAKLTNTHLGNLLRTSAGSGGGGGGGGTLPLNSALTQTVQRFNILNLALSGISNIGSIVSNVFSSLANAASATVGKLVDLAEAAFQGTAKFSDLFKVFNHLPIIGKVFQLFGNFIAYQESLLTSYQALTKSGASFAGNLVDMRIAAARAYMDLGKFGEIVRENSTLFATAIGGVDKGMKIFTEAQNRLIDPKGSFGKNLAGLGVTADEAGNMLAVYMNMQGNMAKANRQSSTQMAESTSALVTNLDAYAKLTGESRDAMEQKLKEQALDEGLKAFLSSLDPDEAASANQALAAALRDGGKGLQDEVKVRIMSNNKIQVAGTEAANNLRVTTRNMSATSADFYFQAFKMGQKNTDFVATMEKGRRTIATGTQQFMGTLGGPGMAGAIHTVSNAFTMTGEQARTYNRLQGETLTTEQRLQLVRAEQEKQFNNTAAALQSAQVGLKIFGNDIGIKFFELLKPLEEPIIKVGKYLLTTFGNVIKYLADDKGPMDKLKNIIEKTLVPAIDWSAKWFTDTIKSLSESTDAKNFFTRLLERFQVVANKISEEFGPPIRTFFNETVKPMLAEIFGEMLEFLITSLRKNSILARALFDETDTEKKERVEKELLSDFTSGQLQRNVDRLEKRYNLLHDRVKDSDTGMKMKAALDNAIERLNQGRTLYEKQQPTVVPVLADKPTRGGRSTGSLGVTGKLFENFGGGTAVNLHGTESVITPSQMSDLVGNALKQNENTKLAEGLNQINQTTTLNYDKNNRLVEQLDQLNTLTKQLINVMQETATNTRRSFDAIQTLNGNLLA